MAFLIKQPQLPQSAANDLAPVSTYQEGNPIPLFFGRDVFGAQWLTQPYNWRTAYGGQNQPDWQYCSILAGYAIGPINFVGKFFRDGKEIANWDYNFPDGVDEHTFTLNPSLALGQAATVIVRRGSESQTAPANVIAGTGQQHATGRGWVTLEFVNIDLGKGNTSLPTFTVELGRHVPAIGAYSGGDSHPYGVNPIAAIYWLLREAKGGYDIDPEMLDATHWGDQAVALETTGIHGRTGTLVHCHPCFKSAKDAGALLSEILAYFDGYLYSDGEQLKIGWFPHQALDASSLPEITEADLTAKPGGAGFPDWSRNPSGAVVMFRDFDRGYQEAPAIVPAPANRETGSVSTPARSERPFIHAVDQAHMIGAEISYGQDSDATTSLQVKKSRAVTSGGAPLMPGDLINWDYGPWSLDLACRVVGRRHRMGSAEDVLEIIRERGEFPRPYVAPVDARVLPTPVDPGEISTGDVRLFLLPSGFGTSRQVAALINRSQREIIGAKLSMSPTGSSPWQEVLDQRYFSAKCVITSAGISDSATTVRITSASVDIARFDGQSAVSQVDDTLLILFGDELSSVGSKTVVSPGVYDLTLLRGRQGSAAAAHSLSTVGFLFFRSELRAAEHNTFYLVRDGSNVYDTGVATKHFKIALMTIDQVGLAKPDDPGISLLLPDLTADGLSGYTILLTKEAHTVACDSAGTVAAGQLGASGFAKTDVIVLRGTTVLTAASGTPAFGQFSIALGTLTNVTATKEDNDTVRADTLTADTGSIEITVQVDGAFSVVKKFTLTKAKTGPAGGAGATGSTVKHIYVRSRLIPATPTGTAPVGWAFSVPGGSDPLWQSDATFDYTGALVGSWSTPHRLTGTILIYYNGLAGTFPTGDWVDGDTLFHITEDYATYRFNGTSWVSSVNGRIPTLESNLIAEGTTRNTQILAQAAATLAAADAVAAAYVSTEASARAGADSSLGAEYVLKVVAGNRIAGFRVTAFGGSGGSSDFVVEADKFTFVDTSGAHATTPFYVDGGVVWIDDAVIRRIAAGKIEAGSIAVSLTVGSGGSINAGSGFAAFSVNDTTLHFGNIQMQEYAGIGTSLTNTSGTRQAEMYAHTGGAAFLVGDSATGAQAVMFSSGLIRGNEIQSAGGGSFTGDNGFQVSGGNIRSNGNIDFGSSLGTNLSFGCGRSPTAGAFVGYLNLVAPDGTPLNVPFYSN